MHRIGVHRIGMHTIGSARRTSRPAASGWFSIGLGLAECLMPRTMARAVGLEGKENLLRAFGMREIATGVGLLMSRDPEPWVWGRVAGDALDLGALECRLARRQSAPRPVPPSQCSPSLRWRPSTSPAPRRWAAYRQAG